NAVLGSVHWQNIRLILVDPRKGAYSIRRQKFVLIKHETQDATELITVRDREQTAFSHARRRHAGDVLGQVRTMANKPLHAPLETGELIDNIRLKRFDCEEWNQANHGADPQGHVAIVRHVQNVIEESVGFIPHSCTVTSEM